MYRNITLLLLDERGATAIEYALIGSLLSIAIVAGLSGVGVKLETYLPQIAAALP